MGTFYESFFVTPVELIKDTTIAASIDRGCSLTKIVYISPDANKEQLRLNFVHCSHDRFEETIKWLKTKLEALSKLDSEKYKIRVTGVGGDKYQSKITEIVGLKIEFVDEFVSQGSGAKFFVANFEDHEFCYPVPEIFFERPNLPTWIQEGIKRAREGYAENEGKKFPVIFGFCGSAFGINVLTEEGHLLVSGATMVGGRSFLGLAKILLGTSDYDEIMELASRGNREALDTLAKDVMAQGEDSQYKFIPSNAPLFPFGNAQNKSTDPPKREDLAISLVAMYTGAFLPMLHSVARNKKIRKIYLGGHFFKAEAPRLVVLQQEASMGAFLDINFLNNGHTGAIGAMITSPEVSDEKRKNMKFS